VVLLIISFTPQSTQRAVTHVSSPSFPRLLSHSAYSHVYGYTKLKASSHPEEFPVCFRIPRPVATTASCPVSLVRDLDSVLAPLILHFGSQQVLLMSLP
jgi:hypothetical protein